MKIVVPMAIWLE